MPNGNLIQRYRPKGVLKHVSMLDRSPKDICQKPFFASNTVKNLALFSRVLTSSMVVMTRDDSFVHKLFQFLMNCVAHRDRDAPGSMNHWSDGVVNLN